MTDIHIRWRWAPGISDSWRNNKSIFYDVYFLRSQACCRNIFRNKATNTP